MANGALYPLPGEFGHHATTTPAIDDMPALRWRIEQGNYEPDVELNGSLRETTRHLLALAELTKSNPAAHDAWQLALQHLEPLRAAIARAREVGKGE